MFTATGCVEWLGEGTGESGEAVEEVRQHRCIAFVLRPRDRVPLPPDASLPLNGVRGVVGHDVQLALVLPKAGDDAAGDVLAIDGDPDLLVRHSAHVVGLRRVEGVEPELGSLAVPPLEHRLRDRAVREPLEPDRSADRSARERLVGGRTDRDVVGMAEDAVGAERDDNGRILLLEDPRDRVTSSSKGTSATPSVRQAQPLVTVRARPGPPRGLVLGLADRPKRRPGGREPVSDVPALAEGGVNQDEPEVRLIRVQRDSPAAPYASSSGCAKTQARVRLRITRSIGRRLHCSKELRPSRDTAAERRSLAG